MTSFELLLWIDPHVAGFDWFLREIIGTNELASARLDHIIEEH